RRAGIEGLDAGREAAEAATVEGVGVVLDQLIEQLGDIVGIIDQSRAHPADDSAREVGAAVRRGQEHNPADERQGLEEEQSAELVEYVLRTVDLIKRAVRVQPPELIAAG